MYYTKFKTKIGDIFLSANDSGISRLDFDSLYIKNNKYIKNDSHPLFMQAQNEIEEYLDGKRKKFTFKLSLTGTDFQKLAWMTLTKIPYGKVLSYGEQAKIMKKPKAQRATGSANGKNPLPIIIPCHRIITSTNELGGYSGDIKLKKKLLELEGIKFNKEKIVRSN
jgi:methylated-DNA-[protein]-cysteine S-methyltransferase